MSSIIVQMLPNFTLEPAPMGAAAARPQGFVPQCWCKRKSLGALEFKLCPREMCIPVKLGVCSILAFPCFLLVLSRGCGARSLSFLTLPLHTLPGPNPPVGPGASGRVGSWSRAGAGRARKVRMEMLQDTQQQVWGLALSGMFRAPRPAAMLSRGSCFQSWAVHQLSQFWTSRIIASITVISNASSPLCL